MRYAARIDRNQPLIVGELRKLGFSVLCLHAVGQGCPDLLIGKDGVNWLVELKSGDKSKLTPDEKRFFETWNGRVILASSLDQILSAVC